jgi:NAD(P)H-flavin reductase
MSSERPRRVRLTDTHALTSRVRALVFEAEGPEPFAYEAGQWVMLRPQGPDGAMFSRPYSVASAPGHAGPNHFEVAVGASTDPIVEALWGLRVGQGLEVGATGGALTWRAARGRGPALLIGAGTGVAPLRALAQEALAQGEGRPIALLAGFRTPDDALWGNELSAWGRSGGRARVEVTLSRPPEGWGGRSGYVQEHVVELARALGPVDAFVCGRSAMASSVAELLVREGGMPEDAVHVEGHG